MVKINRVLDDLGVVSIWVDLLLKFIIIVIIIISIIWADDLPVHLFSMILADYLVPFDQDANLKKK